MMTGAGPAGAGVGGFGGVCPACPVWIALRANSPMELAIGTAGGRSPDGVGRGPMAAAEGDGGGVEVWLSFTTGCSAVCRDHPVCGFAATGGGAALVWFDARSVAPIVAAPFAVWEITRGAAAGAGGEILTGGSEEMTAEPEIRTGPIS